MNSIRVSALAFTAALGLCTMAHAQMSAPAGAPGQRWSPAAMHQQMRMRAAAHLKALHDVLAIRPEQEAAFQAFGASMHPAHTQGAAGQREPGAGWKDHAGQASMSTPDRLDAMIKHFDERNAHMREALVRHADAVRALYAVLSPEQKRTFDALPRLMGHGGEGDHGGWGGRGEGHGPKQGQGMNRPGAGE
jgi:protein CpxP